MRRIRAEKDSNRSAGTAYRGYLGSEFLLAWAGAPALPTGANLPCARLRRLRGSAERQTQRDRNFLTALAWPEPLRRPALQDCRQRRSAWYETIRLRWQLQFFPGA